MIKNPHFFVFHRHQRFYSLLDRFRATVAEETTSPSPPITSHPLDGNPPPGPESVTASKVRFITGFVKLT